MIASPDPHTHVCPTCGSVRECAEPECRDDNHCAEHLDLLALICVTAMEAQFEHKDRR